ncbi:Retrovirus-related Pol polyprotein from transposon 297 [Frankliniella fusca]|uniref:RNA-directed DNA polymerase n=1 Tax=Frankliniella fusca TaxID=407009 RepID=A0AAE1H8T1_9NEOP|nr:Retrovirus-related Pol polyprotein from transposon 297 [Frankliniella fusca]
MFPYPFVVTNQNINYLAYWSKTLNPVQRNYCATHRELLALVESIKAFNHYLAGAPFTVRSDHAALQCTNFKNPTGKLARWLERLAPCQFQVVHVKGTNIGHADALSRRPCEDCKKCDRLEDRDKEVMVCACQTQEQCHDCSTCIAMEISKIRMSESTVDVNWTKVIPDGVTEEEMHKAQVLDENLMPIIVAVQERRRPEYQEIAGCGPKTRALWYQFNSLVIHRKLLYRRFEHPTGQKEKEELQLIVPSKYVKSTVKAYHEQLGLGNHFGVSKTLAYLKRFFWWPNMFNDVYEIIAQAYRSLPHSSHKFSPYEVMFGAPMRTPLDLDRGEPPRQEEMHKMYPFWVRRTMQDIHETVAHMSKKAAKRMKEYYDRTASLAPFKEGDKVYLYYPRRKKGISTKLLTRWEGPYVILNILNDCNARIKNLENKVVIVHIDRLAKCPEGDENKHTDLTSAWLSYAT